MSIRDRVTTRRERARRERRDPLGGYRPTARMCPRGDSNPVVARVELVTRTTVTGRARISAEAHFDTDACPTCGSTLLERCERCDSPIVVPVADRCEFCGLPQPWSAQRLSIRHTQPRPWKPGGTDPNVDEGDGARDPAQELYTVAGSGSLLVIEADITRIQADAIVSNDDVEGGMWTLIASAIKDAADQDVERQSVAQGPFRLGDAWVTDAGNLPAEQIIHVASVTRRDHTKLADIRKCFQSALKKARELELDSLAVPAFGTGPRAIPLMRWLDAIGEDAAKHLASYQHSDDQPSKPLAILIVLYEAATYDTAVRRLVAAVDRAKPD